MRRTLVATGTAVVILGSVMAVAAWAGPKSAGLNKQDRTFLDEAGHGARYEVASGKLAADHASTPEVVRFGQRMVADHSKEYDELQRVGRDVGVTVPDGPDHSQQRILDIFGELHGGGLDCAYTPQEYSDHENDVARFEAETDKGGNAEVKAFARRMLPTLREHLSAAEQALDAIHGC
jgi:putative membrane protein